MLQVRFSFVFPSGLKILLVCPEYDKKKDYYKEFWRIYLQNEIILIDMKDYVVEIKALQEEIKKVEVF